MKLVIVESPAKSKTIQKYLGAGFKVTSSFGHVRDLPKSKLGVDVDDNFKPQYEVPVKARKQVTALKKLAAKADEIYFATDNDREGEAIAWHLMALLKLKKGKSFRIVFDEITKSAITRAVAKPRELDQHMVDAQQARRILDRLVGYELSPLLWKKIRRGLSAGRVQSVAVRMIVEREEEIRAFDPQEYWSLAVQLEKDGDEILAKLTAQAGKRITKLDIESKGGMDKIIAELKEAKYIVKSVERKERQRTAPPPFTTSTLQQAAFNQLGFSSKKTMVVAQQLYEGISLGDKGPTGLITYMRTDSINLATEATAKAKEIVEQEFGADYALAVPRIYKGKSKGAQEAHEAVRPTNPKYTPEQAAAHLDPAQLKLYRLIWQRMVASQMAPAKLNNVSVNIEANDIGFRATGTTVIFDGFVRALGEKAAFKETVLPELKKGDELSFKKLDPQQHQTQPPARYTDASLVKALEEYGIGRPSTYAPTIDTVQRREYVVRNDDKKFEPTELGELVTNLLKEHFPNIVDLKFTAKMETELDAIAEGSKEWQPVIAAFYKPFHANLKKKDKEISKEELTQEKTGESCPECKNKMVIKLGRFGKFMACSNYPECKHTEPIGEEKKLQEQNSGEKCPDCGKSLVIKRGKYGPFMGCSGYPDCKHIKKIEKLTGVKCPKCNKGDIIEKRSRRGKTFYACNQYPECENAYWTKPTGEKCPDCDSLLVFAAKSTAKCSSKECKFKKDFDVDEE